MELALAFIIALGTYEWIKTDDFDPNKHKVVSGTVITTSYDSGDYYHNMVKQSKSSVKWVIDAQS